MIKIVWPGAVLAALLGSAAAAATPQRAEAPAWIIVPGTDSCRTEIEFAAASGRTFPATLSSDGERTELVFSRADAPEQAFLPIRIDQKPYSNLVLRQGEDRSAVRLSPETLAALRKGATLQIGWLGDEPVEIGLAGSDQALTDLRTCGAQVAERFRAQEAARREAAARADAEARAKAVADEQLAAAKAQKAAAEAARERDAADAERLRAEAEGMRERNREQAREAAYPYARSDAEPYDPRDAYPADPYAGRYEPSPYRRW